jgi:hypothetical protein
MAYDIEQMAIVWVPAHTNVPKGWSYINTDDTLAEIEANGYFDDEARLDLNDSIRVTGSDGTSWLRVSQAPPSEVQVVVDTNAVSSLLDGRLWVGNAANAATAVLMSGDATMSNTGAVTIANDAVETAMIADDNVTTAKIADDAVTNAKLAEDTIQTVTVTVSTAELLALATTPKELVAAPGADKFIQFLGAELVLDYATTQYTESGDNMGVKYENAAGVQVSEDIECTGFIDQAADTITNALPKKDAIVAASGAVNKALVLDNLGSNFAAGDSPVDVIVSYKVLTANL